jgi:hypothetical protein
VESENRREVTASQGLRVGQVLMALGCPAWVLVAARERKGTAVGPVCAADWAKCLFGYWLLCWFVAILQGIPIYLGSTPHGQFR